MIDSPKSRFIAALEQKILAEQDPDKAVELAELFALVMLAEMPDRYEATEIEQHVISLFQEVRFDVAAQKRNQTLHVITTPYATGGHTRLMENLAAAKEVSPCLLVTGEYTEQALTRVRKVFDELFFVERYKAANARVYELLMVMTQFSNIVLHIHQFDITTVVACALARKHGTKVFFVNHGDNLFTFGHTVADVWFQLGVNGAKVDEKRKLKAQLAFLGIASGVAQDFKSGGARNSPINVIASAGSSYKFRPLDGDHSYFELIKGLLEKYPEAKFCVLGVNRLRDFWWWPLKLKFWQRVELKGLLSFGDYMDFMAKVSLYVDSYPYHGGTAFSQQLAQGKRCIGLLTGYEGYSPAEQLKHATVAEVMTALDNPIDEEIQQKILEQTILVNSQKAVAERYRAALRGEFQQLDKRAMGLIDIPITKRAESTRLSTLYAIDTLKRIGKIDLTLLFSFFAASRCSAALIYLLKFLLWVSRIIR